MTNKEAEEKIMKQITLKRFRITKAVISELHFAERILVSNLSILDKEALVKVLITKAIPDLNVLLDILCDNDIVDRGI